MKTTIAALLASIALVAPAWAQINPYTIRSSTGNPTFVGTDDPRVNLFTATTPGIVPASGGGTSNCLRADGTWAACGSSYTLPAATTSSRGGVTVSTGLAVDGSGNLSVAYGNTAGTTAQGNDSRLNIFSGSTAGIVPASGGGTANYLRADGVFAPVAGSASAETISVTGGTYALAQSDVQGYATFVVTGSLTSNLVITLPATYSGTWSFVNETTLGLGQNGGTNYTVSVQVAGSSVASLGIGPGFTLQVSSDGTNAYTAFSLDTPQVTIVDDIPQWDSIVGDRMKDSGYRLGGIGAYLQSTFQGAVFPGAIVVSSVSAPANPQVYPWGAGPIIPTLGYSIQGVTVYPGVHITGQTSGTAGGAGGYASDATATVGGSIWNGYISGTVLTIPPGQFPANNTALAVGNTILAGSSAGVSLIAPGTTIQSILTGSGKAGTYQLTGASQTVGSASSLVAMATPQTLLQTANGAVGHAVGALDGNNIATGTQNFWGGITGASIGMGSAIVNGDMDVDQKQAGNFIAEGGIDAWSIVYGTGTYKLGRSTNAPSGYAHSLEISNTSTATPTATTSSSVRTIIEGSAIDQFQWSTSYGANAVLEFCAEESNAGSYAAFIQNVSKSYSIVFPFTLLAANAWQCFSYLVQAPPPGAWGSTTVGVVNTQTAFVGFDTGMGYNFQTTATLNWQQGDYRSFVGATQLLAQPVNSTLYVTAVHLYPANGQAQYVKRPYVQELNLARARYVSTFPQGVQPQNTTGVAGALCVTATSANYIPDVDWRFPVPVYTGSGSTPAVTVYNPLTSDTGTWRDITQSVDFPALVDPSGGGPTSSATNKSVDHVEISVPFASFQGAISTSAGVATLTISSYASGSGTVLAAGSPVIGSGIPAGVTILALGTSTGGNGTATLSAAAVGLNISGEAMTSTYYAAQGDRLCVHAAYNSNWN